MTTWTLILVVYADVWGKSKAVALESVPGFTNAAQCEAAGEKAAKYMSGILDSLKWVCVETGGRSP